MFVLKVWFIFTNFLVINQKNSLRKKIQVGLFFQYLLVLVNTSFLESSNSNFKLWLLGGSYLVTGTSEARIIIYYCNDDEPIKAFELVSHIKLVENTRFANNSLRFLSSGKDNIIKIWKYKSQKWASFNMDISQTIRTIKKK